MNRAELVVEDLRFGYNRNEMVLNNIGFTARSGEMISLLGKNGAGKSTLFRCILGLCRNYEGVIRLNNRDLGSFSARELAVEIAYIPQSHYPSFNYSVLDMVLMGSVNHLSSIGSPGKREMKAAREALDKMGILHLESRGYGQISGGEQQLVLMARAILQDAGIWILDEPAASLDYGNQIRVLRRLRELAGEGYLILQSIHHPGQAYSYSDRVLALHEGRIIADGPPAAVMNGELIKKLYGNDIEWEEKVS